MKKTGVKLLKASISISLSALILLLPTILLLSNLEQQYLILILKIFFAIIFGFGVLSIILMQQGFMSQINEKDINERKDSPIKMILGSYVPIIMKVSAFLCALFFVLIFVSVTVFSNNENLLATMVKYSFILSMTFGTISFFCLLFWAPKPINNCEKHCISHKDFLEFYFYFSNLLKKEKYELRGCTTTKHGNQIFIYRKKRFSVDYFFIIKAVENQDKNFFGEVHEFCHEVLKKELPFNLGPITVNNIVCFESKNSSYADESYINSTLYRRWTNFYVGISFPENEVRLCNNHDVYRIHSFNCMKRHFKELLNLSD